MMDAEMGEILFTVQEFVSGGSMDRRLWGTRLDSVSWHERLQWARDTATAMAYMHSKGFTHRDLKSQNILVEGDRAKVADFGMSRSVRGVDRKLACLQTPKIPIKLRNSSVEPDTTGPPSDDTIAMTGQAGTPQWMAPELASVSVQIEDVWAKTYQKEGDHHKLIIAAQEFTRKHAHVDYGIMVDAYSFGITLYELLAHMVPWKGFSTSEVLKQVAQGQRPVVPPTILKMAPPDFVQIMHDAWHQNAGDRPSFVHMLERLELIKPSDSGTLEEFEVHTVSTAGDLQQVHVSDVISV